MRGIWLIFLVLAACEERAEAPRTPPSASPPSPSPALAVASARAAAAKSPDGAPRPSWCGAEADAKRVATPNAPLVNGCPKTIERDRAAAGDAGALARLPRGTEGLLDPFLSTTRRAEGIEGACCYHYRPKR